MSEGGRARVLIVDDEPDDVFIATRELGDGFVVDSTGSALEGRERLRGERRYDLVVLDYRLGDTNALRFLRESNASAGGPPVIVVSGLDDPRLAQAARDLGAFAFVPKSGFGTGELRRTAEAALAPSPKKPDERPWERSVLDRMSEGLYAVDEGGVIVLANEGLERLLGYGARELLGLGVESVMETEALGAVSRCLARGDAFVETELRARAGAGVRVLVSPSPLSDPGGHLGVVRDFRDFHHRIGELEETNRKLRAGLVEVAVQLLHNVGNAVASVGVHLDDLRASDSDDEEALRVAGLAQRKLKCEASHPLKPVVGLLSSALESLEEAKGQRREALPGIRRAIDYIARAVDQARVFAGRTRTAEASLDVARAAETACSLARDFARSRGLEAAIEARVQDDLERLAIPEAGFEQLLVNLLKNSVESVLARASRDPGSPREIAVLARVVAADPSDALVVEVRDTGAGATPETCARAFELGFTTRPGGSGFGLHASAEFVERLGGRIELVSPGIDRGATVRIEVPVSPRAAAGKAAA